MIVNRSMFTRVLSLEVIVFTIYALLVPVGIQSGLDIVLAQAAPVANAGADQNVDESSLVTLDGSLSSSPGKTPIVTYEWIQVDSNPIVSLSGNGSSVATFLPKDTMLDTFVPAPTVYTFNLVVTDTNGLSSAPDDVIVTVNPHVQGQDKPSPDIDAPQSVPQAPELLQTPSQGDLVNAPPSSEMIPLEPEPNLLSEQPDSSKPELKSQESESAGSTVPPPSTKLDTQLLNKVPDVASSGNSGPQLIESNPADGSGDVPVDIVMLNLTFDKKIDIKSASISLTDDSGAGIKTENIAKGSKLTMEPKKKLIPGTHYTVVIDQIKDKEGSAGTASYSFSTLPSASEPPVRPIEKMAPAENKMGSFQEIPTLDQAANQEQKIPADQIELVCDDNSKADAGGNCKDGSIPHESIVVANSSTPQESASLCFDGKLPEPDGKCSDGSQPKENRSSIAQPSGTSEPLSNREQVQTQTVNATEVGREVISPSLNELVCDDDSKADAGGNCKDGSIPHEGASGSTEVPTEVTNDTQSNNMTDLITSTLPDTSTAAEPVTCPEPPALNTISGNDSDNLIAGTRCNDQINGGLGNDRINGLVGDDTIVGDGGDDNLDGAEGNDHLTGLDGDDTMLGGSGDDYIIGSAGADYADGGKGNDDIKGGNDDDELQGGDGNDSLNGESGNDRLDGGNGDDGSISGGPGDDILVGGAGADGFYCGDGYDAIEDFEPSVDSIPNADCEIK